MRVLLKLVLECDPENAWRAIRSPSVLQRASAPLMSFDSLEPEGFPQLWDEGEHPVRVFGGGLVPLGEQVIVVSYPHASGDTRMMRDSGYGVSGIFPLVRHWEHSMAIAPAAGGRTLYRDQLVFDAGPITRLLWPMYWSFWQWRAFRMKRLARDW